jgi:hypothetical protein
MASVPRGVSERALAKPRNGWSPLSPRIPQRQAWQLRSQVQHASNVVDAELVARSLGGKRTATGGGWRSAITSSHARPAKDWPGETLQQVRPVTRVQPGRGTYGPSCAGRDADASR